MDEAARQSVRRRADNRCEYCLLRQEHSDLTHHIEHVVAKQHGGDDALENDARRLELRLESLVSGELS